jgi:hypothetical protein
MYGAPLFVYAGARRGGMSDHSAIEWTDATWNPVTGLHEGQPWLPKLLRGTAGKSVARDGQPEVSKRVLGNPAPRSAGPAASLASLEANLRQQHEKNVKMYHLLFFSKHPTGLTLWRNITKIEASGQRRLSFTD